MIRYNVKRIVRSFRDLEVYQRTLECSVVVFKDIKPKLTRLKFPMLENMINCAMTIPLSISEAHSIRFGDHKTGLLLLEKAMAGCNKMVVYLEQARGIYGVKLEGDLIEDLIRRYSDVRTKIFRLEKSWQRWTEPKR
jgi:hypothetical protein